MSPRSPNSGLRLTVLLTCCLALAAVGTATATGASTSVAQLDGAGTADDPYVISNADDLQAIQEEPDAHYELQSDVDASDTAFWDGTDGFDPVGGNDEPFAGTLDGNGHTVHNLTVRRSGEDDVGLVGYLHENGTLRNLHLEDADVRGEDGVGAIAGHAEGDLRNVTVHGEVTATGEAAGGIAGLAEGTVSDARANVRVEGEREVGGAVGRLDGDAVRVAATGSVVAEGNRTGGLVGTLDGDVGESFATGTVDGEHRVGGLVGLVEDDASVERSYATGDVSGHAAVGGAVGTLDGDVAELYAVGAVEGDEDVGGVIGAIYQLTIFQEPVEDAYWLSGNGEAESGVGEGDAEATNRSRSELTGSSVLDTASGLTYEGVFQPTGQYPVLEWQVEDVNLTLSENGTVRVGESVDADATLTLADGSTATAATATYESAEPILDVDRRRPEATDTGTTELTATVGDHSDAVEVEVLEPLDVTIVEAALPAETVVNGSAVQVEATVANDGGAGAAPLTIAVDGEPVAEESVTLESESEQDVAVSWTPESGGNVTLRADGDGTDGDGSGDETNATHVGDLELVAPDAVTLTAMDPPERVAAGEPYQVNATLSNDADEPIGVAVQYAVGADPVARNHVTVPSGQTEVTFEHTVEETGSGPHTVSALGEELTATLEVVEPVSPTVTAVEVPETVDAGNATTVAATVANDGGPGTTEVVVEVGEETVHTETVELAGDGTTTVSSTVDLPEEATTRNVTVRAGDASQTATVDVVAPASSDGLPGFGVLAAVVALFGGAALRRRGT